MLLCIMDSSYTVEKINFTVVSIFGESSRKVHLLERERGRGRKEGKDECKAF